MEERVCVFIDGSNLYHALREVMGRTDLSFGDFARKLAGDRPMFRVYYYNALQDPNRNADSAREQQEFLSMLRTTPYMEVRLGTLKVMQGVTVEKGVDVMLATDVVQYAFDNVYDTAIIVSGDADYAYALQLVKNKGKHVEVAYFETNISKELMELADIRHFLDRKYFDGLWSGRRIRQVAASGGRRRGTVTELRPVELRALPAAEPLPEEPEEELEPSVQLAEAGDAGAVGGGRRRRRRRRGGGGGALAHQPDALTPAGTLIDPIGERPDPLLEEPEPDFIENMPSIGWLDLEDFATEDDELAPAAQLTAVAEPAEAEGSQEAATLDGATGPTGRRRRRRGRGGRGGGGATADRTEEQGDQPETGLAEHLTDQAEGMSPEDEPEGALPETPAFRPFGAEDSFAPAPEPTPVAETDDGAPVTPARAPRTRAPRRRTSVAAAVSETAPEAQSPAEELAVTAEAGELAATVEAGETVLSTESPAEELEVTAESPAPPLALSFAPLNAPVSAAAAEPANGEPRGEFARPESNATETGANEAPTAASDAPAAVTEAAPPRRRPIGPRVRRPATAAPAEDVTPGEGVLVPSGEEVAAPAPAPRTRRRRVSGSNPPPAPEGEGGDQPG